METCRNCGGQIEASFVICPECGTPVQRGMTAPARATSTVAIPQGKLAYLVVQNGASAGQSMQLGVTTDIGRDQQSNQLVLSDPHASSHHGRVRFEDGTFVYHDLASSGGSWLLGRNGDRKRISTPTRLMHGDTIEVGKTRLVFMEAARR